MKYTISLIAILFVALFVHAQELRSPDESFKLIFELEEGTPTYQLELDGKTVIKQSKLGLELKDMESFLTGFEVETAFVRLILGQKRIFCLPGTR